VVDTGVTTRTSGSSLVLGYLPHVIGNNSMISDWLEAIGESITEFTKIRERKVRNQHWIDTTEGSNLDKIGLGLANIKRYGDDDEKYRYRIKSVMGFDGGGNLNTMTGMAQMEYNTGSWFAWHVLRKGIGDGLECNRFGRCFGESGRATLIEWLYQSGQTFGSSADRFNNNVEQFKALGVTYQGFGETLPSDLDYGNSDTGGWYYSSTGTELYPFTVSVSSTGISYIYGGSSIHVSFISTGDGTRITKIINPPFNLLESGHTTFNFWVAGNNPNLVFDKIRLFSSVYVGNINNGTTVVYETGHFTSWTGGTFKNEANWNDPASFTVSEGASTDVRVIPETGDHLKVVELYDNNNSASCKIQLDFPSDKSTGTVEFWYRITDGTQPCDIWDCYEGGTRRFILGVDSNNLQYYDGSWNNITTINDNEWYHLKITFRTATGTSFDGLNTNEWNLHVTSGGSFGINGITGATTTKYGGFPFSANGNNINKMIADTRSASYGYSMFFDAVDYDGNTGYYDGRNKNFDSGSVINWTTGISFGNDYLDYTKDESGNYFTGYSFPTTLQNFRVDLYNYDKTYTGSGFNSTSVSGVSFMFKGETGSSIDLYFDGLHFGKRYMSTGSNM